MTTIPLLTDSPRALEALSRVELVYTDLDGTLLGLGGSVLAGDDGEPSSATADAIVRLNAAGLTVVVATGRNRIQCTELTRLLGWSSFIAELGGVVMPDRFAEPIYSTGDWPVGAMRDGETPHEAIARVGAPELLCEMFPGRIEPHAPYHYHREATHLLRGQIDVPAAQAALDRLDLAVTLIDNGVIHPVKTGLVRVDEVHSYHLAPRGVTKAHAIAADIERRGLKREQTASIGDSASDVEMAEGTAVCVLVANAFGDAEVGRAVAGHENVFATKGHRGIGWAEFADAWLGARG
jgi:hydroxymethylpyrimidine pyrophosphatase-like HAD family hydrolase